MSGVADTSIDAYRKLDLSACAQKLLAVMQPGIEYTDRDLAAILGEDGGWVPDRRHKLIAAGLVERGEDVKSPRSGTFVMTHRLTAKQLELAV